MYEVVQTLVGIFGHHQGSVLILFGQGSSQKPGRQITVRPDNRELVMDQVIAHRSLEAYARTHPGPQADPLAEVSFHRGKQIPPDHRSIAFRLVFQSPERTLTNAEVDEQLFAVLEALYRKKNIVVRDFARIAELKLFSEERFSEELRKVYGV